MKKTFGLFLLISLISLSSIKAQVCSCQQAFYNLQTFSNSVTYQYNLNINWIAHNVHPYYHQGYVNNLNIWYNQQAKYINNTYSFLLSTCNVYEYPQGQANPVPTNRGENWDVALELPEEQNSKKVRIRIPDNPVGWKHD